MNINPHIYRWTTGQALNMMSDVLEAPVFHSGEWQGMDTRDYPTHATHELTDVKIVVEQLPEHDMAEFFYLSPEDQDWAEEHFKERVSGEPMNPAPSHLKWPYAVRGNAMHTNNLGKFDHTYPERLWPKHAYANSFPPGDIDASFPMNGIRFPLGDLENVIHQLATRPGSRQGYVPLWFPEDTWAADNGKRVPCTLGYHFMVRDGKLSCRYFMRSCDVYRHLRNDLYLAGMLTYWMADAISSWIITHQPENKRRVDVGGLSMDIVSLHGFVADERNIRRVIRDISRNYA